MSSAPPVTAQVPPGRAAVPLTRGRKARLLLLEVGPPAVVALRLDQALRTYTGTKP